MQLRIICLQVDSLIVIASMWSGDEITGGN